MSRYKNSANKIYVGNLGSSVLREDLEDAFSYYGPIKVVWVARNPPGFAFIEFEDSRDAEDAVRGLDGKTISGRRVRVELARPSRMRANSYRGSMIRPRGRPFNPEDRCFECDERGHYARDCPRKVKVSRYRSRSRSRSRPRSKSRSVSRPRVRSRSLSRSQSPSRLRRSRSRSLLRPE